ncbi:MAG TPA: YciI family protein [Usitatibacter sp.]|nr:YciI family protein [Usitatibacter sp.]
MRYLCLLVWDEERLAKLAPEAVDRLNAAHLSLNEQLIASGHFIEAEPLEPSAMTTCVRVRDGRASVTDGPFAETKEQVAGFYLIEARDLNEAIQVAAQLPSAAHCTIEVRPCRQLVVDGVARASSSKSRPSLSTPA